MGSRARCLAHPSDQISKGLFAKGSMGNRQVRSINQHLIFMISDAINFFKQNERFQSLKWTMFVLKKFKGFGAIPPRGDYWQATSFCSLFSGNQGPNDWLSSPVNWLIRWSVGVQYMNLECKSLICSHTSTQLTTPRVSPVGWWICAPHNWLWFDSCSQSARK